MNKKPLVAALAALSLAGAAFAGQVPQQARHNDQNSPASAIDRALAGNSIEGYIPHNYINNGTQGLWISGMGIVSAAYNSAYVVAGPSPVTPVINNLYTPGSNFTIAVPSIDAVIGYDSNNVGFVTSVAYSDTPVGVANTITLVDTKSVPEAYVSYKINDMFAVKAGKFISDFGSYDPTQALYNLTTVLSTSDVTGVEGVFAGNGFHASVTGAMVDGATKLTNKVINNARPNTVILNGGYDMPFQGGSIGVQGSYTNHGTVLFTDSSSFGSEWTIGGHYATDVLMVKADVLNLRNKAAKTPWVWEASADYKLGNQGGHGMVVGAYGDYVKNAINYVGTAGATTDVDVMDLDWLLGAKFGYTLNKYAQVTAYVQHANMKAKAVKDNTTALVALTVKV